MESKKQNTFFLGIHRNTNTFEAELRLNYTQLGFFYTESKKLKSIFKLI
jgi:hypothetical protein